jgi:hypothetical protein
MTLLNCLNNGGLFMTALRGFSGITAIQTVLMNNIVTFYSKDAI